MHIMQMSEYCQADIPGLPRTGLLQHLDLSLIRRRFAFFFFPPAVTRPYSPGTPDVSAKLNYSSFNLCLCAASECLFDPVVWLCGGVHLNLSKILTPASNFISRKEKEEVGGQVEVEPHSCCMQA